VLFILAHTGHHLVASLLTPLLPFIRDDFGMTYTQTGWIVSAFSLTYGISNLPGGWLADRIGPRTVVTIGVAGVALAGILAALSVNMIMLALFLTLMGISGGGYHPSAAPLISASVQPERRGWALGLHQVGGSTSFFIAPLLAAGIAGVLGWRGAFITVAIPTLIFGLVFYIILGRLEQDNGTGMTDQPIGRHDDDGEKGLSLPHLIAIIVMGIASMTLIMSTTYFVPLYAVDNYGISDKIAAASITVYFLGGVWGGPLGGYLADRLGKISVILMAGLIGAPTIFLLNLAPFGIAFYAVLVLLGTLLNMGLPVVEAYIMDCCPDRHRSKVLGIYYSGSRGGAGVGAPILGYLIDQYGFFTGFSIIAGTLAAVTLVCTVMLWRR